MDRGHFARDKEIDIKARESEGMNRGHSVRDKEKTRQERVRVWTMATL